MYEFDYNKERKLNNLTTIVWLLIVAILMFFALSVKAQTKYVLPCDTKLLIESEKVLLSQVGVKELTGHNDGKVIAMYLASVGLNGKYPYCAAGQYYCFYIAYYNLNMPVESIPIARTGLANKVFNDAMKEGVRVNCVAKRHDLIVWKTPKKSTGHIERIYKVNTGGNVYTVGFNTGSGDPREGSGVFKKKRNLYHPLGRMAVRGLVGFNG